ncbi:MAG: diguanylate cyclase [Paraglaciecola sp.]|nr:diguanylate cyclase [Paraglaciecola sp.]
MLNNPFNVNLSRNWLLVVACAVSVVVIIAITNFSNTVNPSRIPVIDVEYLVDTRNQYTVGNIQHATDTLWHDVRPQGSLGISDDLHWFRFSLKERDHAQSWLLEIDYPMLDNVNLWFVQNSKVLTTAQIGDTLPFAQRNISHENFLFPIPKTEGLLEVYISVRSTGPMRLPLNIWQQHSYLSFASENSLIMGLFFGLILAMGLTNLFFFSTTGNLSFLVYSGYVIFLGLTVLTIQGLGYRYLWPNFAWLQQHAIGIFANLALCLSIIFCDLLLNVKTYSMKMSRMLKTVAYIYLAAAAISAFVPLELFHKVFLLMLSAGGILIFSVAIWLWLKGLAIARYYTLAWAVLFFSVIVISLDDLNIIKIDLPSHYLLMLGAAIETIMLALILAISHDQQRQTLLNTQSALLDKERQAQHAQKDLLALQENNTEDLEYKVQERTLELEIALRELSETNRELQEKNTLDALTGIRNRSYFDKKYQAEIRRSRREKTQLSVVMIDIDHFKKVNDQYGHLVGDECIKTVALTLQTLLKRPSDAVCRYGGEEFALILPSTDLEGALVLVERLRAEIEKNSIQTEGGSVNITISAGIGTAIADLNQPEDIILALADKQLYAAKNAGRNNVQGSYLDDIQQQDES